MAMIRVLSPEYSAGISFIHRSIGGRINTPDPLRPWRSVSKEGLQMVTSRSSSGRMSFYEWFVLRTLLTLASFLFFLPSMELPFLQRISMASFSSPLNSTPCSITQIKALPIFPNETINGGLFFSEAQLPLPRNQRGENSSNALPLRDLDELANKIALRRLPKTRLARRSRHSQGSNSVRTFSSRLSHRNLLFIRIWDEMRWLGMFLHFFVV